MALDKNGVPIPSYLQTKAVANDDGSITYPDGAGGTITTKPDGSSVSTNGGITTTFGPAQNGQPGPVVSSTKADGSPATAADAAAVNDANNKIDPGEVAKDAVLGVKSLADQGNIVGTPGINNNTVNQKIGNVVQGTIDGKAPDQTSLLGSGGGVPGVGGSGSGSGSGGSGGSLSDSVNKVADEAFGYADANRNFELGGLDKANAALDPAKSSYASMYGPGGTQAGPGVGEQAFTAQGGNLLNPTAQSAALATASPFLSGQSPGMSAYQNVAGQLSGPTLSSQTYAGYSGDLAAPSAGESRYAATQGKYDTNALSQAAPGLNAKLNGPTNLESNLGAIAGGYAAPSASQSTYKAQSGQLGTAGGLEQFAASDLAGTNPYYDQLQAQQSADIDASMNARGGFNSGAALKAQALGASNLRAQQYQQEGQLQGAAQTAEMSRLGQQQSAAGASDTARYAGLSGQQSALSTADAQRLAATNSQIGLAGTQASTDLGYLQGGQTAANQAGAANLARTQTGIGLSQSTDASNLAQNLGYTGAANAAGAGQVNQYNALGNLAAGQDQASQAQYMNYLNQAQAMQGAAQQRQQQGFTDASGLGALQSQNTLGAYGKAGDEYSSMVGAGLGAQLNAAQIQAQMQQNDKNNQNSIYTSIIKGVLS